MPEEVVPKRGSYDCISPGAAMPRAALDQPFGLAPVSRSVQDRARAGWHKRSAFRDGPFKRQLTNSKGLSSPERQALRGSHDRVLSLVLRSSAPGRTG